MRSKVMAPNKPRLLKPTKLAYGTLVMLGVFDLLYTFAGKANWLEFLVGLPLTLLLPGLLTLYAMSIHKLTTKTLLLAVSLSVLELMLAGLACNYVPQIFGSHTPLDSAATLSLFNVLVALTSGIVLARKRQLPAYEIPRLHLRRIDLMVITATSLLAILGVGGTFRLNNGGSNIILLYVLGGMLMLATFIIWRYAELRNFTVLAALFGMGFSILLMTSLRSWNVSGHDIKTEYLVFSLTNDLHKWNISNYRNAYNACLSITILPVMLSKLFHSSGAFIFKFVFQILFALTPLIIFELARTYTKSILAYLAAFIFISYPTFTTDSAMLTRQETAFLFFGIIILIWFSHAEDWLKNKWRALVLILSLGVIFSHYSTTYMYVILLVCSYLFIRLAMLGKNNRQLGTFLINGRMVLIIFLAAFFWFTQTTNVSKNLTSVVKGSIMNLPHLLQQDNRDSSVNNILVGVKVDPVQQLNNYIDQTEAPSNSQDGQAIVGSLSFNDDVLGPNAIAKRLHLHAVTSLINNLYYTLLPRLYQLLVVVGLVLLLWSRRARRTFAIPGELTLLGAAGIIVLGLEVVLPNISLDYGLMRAFQQCLFFLIVPLLAAFIILSERFRIKKWLTPLMTLYALVLFAIYTGLAPQILGGSTPAMVLNNSGPYYGEYYTHTADLRAFEWVKQNVPRGTKVHAADYHTAAAYDPGYPFTLTGVLPFQLSSDDTVLLNYEQVVDHTDYIIVGGKLLPAKLDSSFLSDNKNLIYNDGGSAYYQ